jgi:SAM-dependent methyltransferase
MELSEAIELIRQTAPHKAANMKEPIAGQTAAGGTVVRETGATEADLRETWADLGCGSGLFSHALASLLSPGSTIHAVDKILPVPGIAGDFNKVAISELALDFEKDRLPLGDLDGILMANSLHYIKDKTHLLGHLISCMRPQGRFLIVEYETTTVNRWVPFPVTFAGLERLFREAGFSSVRKLRERNSIYNRAKMYSALAER